MQIHLRWPTAGEFALLAAAAAVLAVFLRILIPVLWSIAERARQHGPAPIGSPNSGGRWLGWITSLLWSIGEAKREETFEHSHETTRIGEVLRGRTKVPMPIRAPNGAPEHIADPSEPEFQELNMDGSQWWNGRYWIDSERFVPPAAPRTVDGSHWWDGQRWRWVPNEFNAPKRELPRRAEWPIDTSRPFHASAWPVAAAASTRSDSFSPPSSQSWLTWRRRHTADRRVEMIQPAQRSDPPPDHLRADLAMHLQKPQRRRRKG